MKAAVARFVALLTFVAICCSGAAQSDKAIQTLEPGKPVERGLSGGQSHDYQIQLAAGQCLDAVVEQRGIDVVVTLFGPDGKQLVEVDSPNGAQGPEPLLFIAELSGAYRLNVRSLEKDAPAGRYEAKIEELKLATGQDRERIVGQAVFAEADRLKARATAESLKAAVDKYSAAAAHFRAAREAVKEADALNAAGLLLSNLGGAQKALEFFQQSLALRRTGGDRSGEGAALNNIGLAYRSLGENRKALDYYSQSLAIARAAGNRAGEATILNNMGAVLNLLGENQKALECYSQALPLLKAGGNRRGEANALNGIGAVYWNLGESQKGLENYNQALLLWRALGDRRGQAMTLDNLGQASMMLGRNQEAQDCFQEALPIWRSLGDKVGEASTLNNMGWLHSRLGETPQALDDYDQALTIHRAAGNRRGEAQSLNNIAALYQDLGESPRALEYYTLVLPILKATADRPREAIALNNIGAVWAHLGENQKALEYYSPALEILRAVGDRRGEANTLNNIGAVYARLGEGQLALEYYYQALLILKAVREPRGEAATLGNIGSVYRDLGEDQKALEYFNLALPISRAAGDKAGEAATLNNIGGIYLLSGRREIALEYYSQALPIERAAGNQRGEAATLNNMGYAFKQGGENQKALEYYSQVLQLVRAVGDRRGEAWTLDNMGAIYSDLAENQKALEVYGQALVLARTAGDRKSEATVLGDIAIAEHKLGHLPQARTQMEAALKVLEAMRSSITSQELRTSFFASVHAYHRFYVDLLMQLNRTGPRGVFDALALEASERGRARGLLEMLREGRADIRKEVDKALLEKEKALTRRLSDKSDRLMQMQSGKRNEGQVAVFEKEISELETELQQVEATIRKTSPRYAALTQPEPLKAAQIRQEVLDAGTVLLEYSLGKDRSYLWVVGPESMDSFELPKQEEIESAARLVYELLTARNRRVKDETEEQTRSRISKADAEFAGAAGKLSRMVLGPAANLIQGKRLLVVGDGALQYIPFEALPDPVAHSSSYTPLIAAHEVVSVPSASILAEMRRETAGRKSAPGAVAIFADPIFNANDPRLKTAEMQSGGTGLMPNQGLERSAREVGLTGEEFRLPRLPFTRQEAEQISLLAGKGPVMKALDFRASVTIATSPEVAGYRMVHFATHGLLNAEHPSLSGIVLSLVDDKGKPQNGFLKLQDVYNLNLPAELVVLSACQTGLGKEIKGEGLVGLTRGFMYAGAKRVVASLWKVDDVATAELMKRFYRGMLVERKRPAEAMRAAQVAMQGQRRWSSPYYWAAFVLQGEWK